MTSYLKLIMTERAFLSYSPSTCSAFSFLSQTISSGVSEKQKNWFSTETVWIYTNRLWQRVLVFGEDKGGRVIC